MKKKVLSILLSCLFAYITFTFMGANTSVFGEIADTLSTDAELWVNETKIDTESKFYIGMTVKELLDAINDEGLEIDINSPYAKYSDEGIGTHDMGFVFVDAQPFYFRLDSENRVKYINTYLAGLETIGGTTASFKEGMSDNEIEAQFGLPFRKYLQSDTLFYLYKFDGYYIEFDFDIEQAAFEGKERSDWEPWLSRFIMMKNIQDYFDWSEHSAYWYENDPRVSIDDDPGGDGQYSVEYNYYIRSDVIYENNVRLLMVDGGFVPNPQLIIENGRTMAPLEIIGEIPGTKVEWNEIQKIITITGNNNVISLTVGHSEVMVNNIRETLDTLPQIINTSIYVPLRYVAEALGREVQYVPDLTYGNKTEWPWLLPREAVSVVTIDTPVSDEKEFTVEEGLAAIKSISVQTYENLLISMEKIGDSFNENHQDYEPQDIYYANFNIGRYFVYKLKKFELYPIFFNRYTGEIYSEKAGRPFARIDKGFINIAFMFQ